MDSEIKRVQYPGGECQRVQILRMRSWEDLKFLASQPDPGALSCFARIYRKFLVPACPWIFGNLVLFRLPEDMEQPFSTKTRKYGSVSSPLTAAAAALEKNLHFFRGKPRFADGITEAFYRELEKRGCVQVVRGKLPVTKVIPVANQAGFLTKTAENAKMKVNSSFFIMDSFDCATPYDHLGIPFGLNVQRGRILQPTLYHREALLVRKDGTVTVTMPDIRELPVKIGGIRHLHGQNARIFTRPKTPVVLHPGKKLVIIGCRVVSVVERGPACVPASGFVLCPREDCSVKPGDPVEYGGMEDVTFGIQVGNSILRDGQLTGGFRSKFYNIRHFEPVPYPPSLYPMDFDRGRAARIALGADKEGNPMLLWAEGAPKLGYVAGKHSCGASLKELGGLCRDAGMWNAVNLDGGGSAQILLRNSRHLEISDRREEDFSEAERPVPAGLMLP